MTNKNKTYYEDKFNNQLAPNIVDGSVPNSVFIMMLAKFILQEMSILRGLIIKSICISKRGN